jgi:hypothetical protein
MHPVLVSCELQEIAESGLEPIFFYQLAYFEGWTGSNREQCTKSVFDWHFMDCKKHT